MITRLEVYRYRCFAAIGVDFGEYSVLAGANGSGKTTLLDIPSLLGDLSRQRVCSDAFLKTQACWATAPRAHTLVELIHQERGDDFAFAVEARLPSEIVLALMESSPDSIRKDETLWPKNLRYELCLQVLNKRELHVRHEYLFLFPDGQRPDHERFGGTFGTSKSVPKTGRPRLLRKFWRPVIFRDGRLRTGGRTGGVVTRFCSETSQRSGATDSRIEPTQLALGAVSVDHELFPGTNWFRTLLEQQSLVYAPQSSELRTASPPGQSKQLVPSGSNVPWLAHELKQKDPGQYRAWVEHVQVAFPEIRAIDVRVREEDYHAYFAVTYAGDYVVTSSGLSDGTLRILALTLAPYVIGTPTLLSVEEPENGIHPQAIELVLQSLSSVYDGQVWVSSQSPIVLAQSRLHQVFCCRLRQDGSVEVIRGDKHPRFQDWKGGVDLGTLFAAGVLG